jgi:dolichyl-phosphate beta-glucosyltransferase
MLPVVARPSTRIIPARVASVELILPVYQEVDQIGAVVPQVVRWLADHPEASAVFVDDGSSDGTPDAIDRALRDHPGARVRLERSPMNRGKGAVVREAMLASHADIRCFTDGDLAYALDHVDLLVDAIEQRGADVAIGNRDMVTDDAQQPEWRRRLSGSMFNLAVRLILGLPYADTQAGLKGFRSSAAARIFASSRVDGFAFDAEILFLAQRQGCRIAEVPARVAENHASLGSTVSLLTDPWRMLWALLRVRFIHRASARGHPAPAP